MKHVCAFALLIGMSHLHAADKNILNNQLFSALEMYRPLSYITKLLDQGASVHTKNSLHMTPLHIVTSNGNFDAAQELLKHGADIYSRNLAGETALHIATRLNRLRFINRFLTYDGNINIKDNWGDTPLHNACANGHIDAIETLLIHHASPIVINRMGKTPVDLALKHNHSKTTGIITTEIKRDRTELTKQLLQEIPTGRFEDICDLLAQGAYPQGLGMQKLSPMYVAINYRRLAIIKHLHEKYHISIDTPLDHHGDTAFHRAITLSDIAHYFIEHSNNMNPINFSGETPLHQAAICGHPQTVRKLLQYNANPHAINDAHETPLHHAIRSATLLGNRNAITSIIDLLFYGADVNAQAALGKTALHDACQFGGNRKIVSLLLLFGADVNLSMMGSTPLHLAAATGRTHIVKDLLDHAAPINALNFHGNSALHLAATNNHLDTVELLFQRGANIQLANHSGNTALHNSFRPNTSEPLIRKLIQHPDAPINSANEDGTTALHLATTHSRRTVLKLLKRNAMVNALDKWQFSPLHYAALKDHAAIAEDLISYGANINAQNQHGETPLHLSATYDHKKMVAALLKHGADPYVKNSRDKTPADLARERGYNNTAEFIDNWENEDIKEPECE